MNALSREQLWNAFLENGLPSRRDERWKYTDFAFLVNKKFPFSERLDFEHLRAEINNQRLPQDDSILLVLINGYFVPTLSDMYKLPENMIACSMQEALVNHFDLVNQYRLNNFNKWHSPFAAINENTFADGLFLYVPEQCVLAKPIHLLSLALADNEFVANVHHIIALGSLSKLTLIEEYASMSDKPYFMNMVTTVTVEKNAKLEHIKIQAEGKEAIHMANIFVNQKQDSRVDITNFSSGGMFARDDLAVTLLERGAECRTAGFYHLRHNNQYIDNHIDLMHMAPHSQSEMLYKGIIENKSRAVFNGRLYVEKEAQKILAYQANHNLLLSKDAEAYSKPELEIYADDVKCKHGATTGQLDQDALFYLRARGIKQPEAVNILIQGFAEEIFQRIAHFGIKERVRERML